MRDVREPVDALHEELADVPAERQQQDLRRKACLGAGEVEPASWLPGPLQRHKGAVAAPWCRELIRPRLAVRSYAEHTSVAIVFVDSRVA